MARLLLFVIERGAVTLVIRIRGRQVLAVTSCAPLCVLGAFQEMLLLATEGANVALPGLAVVAATCLGLAVDIVRVDRGELTVGVCVWWARHGDAA